MAATPRLLIFTPTESAGLLDQSALTSAGYEVTSVALPQDAESGMIYNQHYILLIIAHPSAFEGLRFSETLLRSYPFLPIILVTRDTDHSLVKQALEIGVADYLTAPVDPTTLLNSVGHALVRYKSIRPWPPIARVLNDLMDGFVLVDLDYHLLFVNQSTRRIFHIQEDQPEGKMVDEIFTHPDFLDIFKPYRTFPYRNEITMEDGCVFSAHSSVIPDVGIAVTLHEITHLKELDRIKTDFVNTVSHDIRSPLTAVYGFIGLIDRVGPINQQQTEFIRHIQSSLQHITSLINDLLELGRMEADYDVLMAGVNLKDILVQAMGNLEYQYSEKMQDVVLSVPDDIPEILGNPLHLQRMATNLIENAIKFTPAMGKIQVRCKAKAGQLILEVADNGPGIPLADQPHIFEKFYRGKNLSKVTPGTGLGLSIVKSIVDKHQGRIWVESSPLGTTFSVIFPIK